MNIAVEIPRLVKISITDDEITAFLNDGRSISVPLAWSWRLSEATPMQRQHYEVNTPPAESRWLRLTAKAGVVSFADSLRLHRQL